VSELARLPGIGERTALRLALHLLEQKKERAHSLAQSLIDMADNVSECEICCNLTAYDKICSICQKSGRERTLICVVSCIQDLMAIETSNSFRGLYHVLHGVLAPLNGIGPDDLRIKLLQKRVLSNNNNNNKINELIIATPATVEGEATALYICQELGTHVGVISRIASGVPVGGDLQFADRLSLARALMQRRPF
jgi:recombination protein RecR